MLPMWSLTWKQRGFPLFMIQLLNYAVKMHKGNVIETFEQFIDPGNPLSQTTINLTGITDEMVRGSKSEEEVLRMFKEFSEGTILVVQRFF